MPKNSHADILKRTPFLAAAIFLVACGSQAAVPNASDEKADDGVIVTPQQSFKITSFETVYGDGHTSGPSYRHQLHYERDSGNVVITKSAYGVEPNIVYATLSPTKKEVLDLALDSIVTSIVKDVYLTNDTFPASSGDGLSMSIALSGKEQTIKTEVDTFYPELIPSGLYFLFSTSFEGGRWYLESYSASTL